MRVLGPGTGLALMACLLQVAADLRPAMLAKREALDVQPSKKPLTLQHLMIRAALLPFLCLALSTSLASADASIQCAGAPNSVGSGATIRWSGPFDPIGGVLFVDELPANAPGIMVYGLQSTNLPFGDGFSCVGGVNWILARKGANAQGSMHLDVASESDPDDLIWLQWPGNDQFYFQYMYRDFVSGGTGFNLSATVRVSWQ